MNKRSSVLLLVLLSSVLLASCANGNGETPLSSSAPDSSTTIPDEDVVASTHLKLDSSIFQDLMKTKTNDAFDSSPAFLDITRDGVERMRTATDRPNQDSDYFTNYVDGDTSQFTSYNGGYTVRVRYLAIDTPESTSEVEEWGKAASNFNKSKLSSAKHVIVQSAGSAKTGQKAVADIDTYQRTLAYVWYTEVENPTQNDFRNLNLEMVYNGFSLFNGARADMDSAFYDAFFKANQIATAQKKNMFSGERDPDYYYGSPKQLSLKALYDRSLYSNKDSYGHPYSVYSDNYTKYSFDGYVSRVVGTSFHIQDTIDGKDYGLYVFTLRSYAPVKVGNRIRVSGILDYYGGTYELKGISYSFFNPQEGDIQYLDANGNPTTASNVARKDIQPLPLTPEQISSGEYEGILAEVKSDNSTFFFKTGKASTFNLSSGGSTEVNSFSEGAYPYYNTDNGMVLFGYAGTNKADNASMLKDNSAVRLKIEQDVVVTGDFTTNSYSYTGGVKGDVKTTVQTNTAITSYQFFTGGTNYYVPGNHSENGMTLSNASYVQGLVSGTPSIPDGVTVYESTFKPKSTNKVVGIVGRYVSTSGNMKYSLSVASASDLGTFTDVG